MKLHSVEAVFGALNNAGIRYLVAGGLAGKAHGYSRLTMDIDLVIALDPGNIARAFEALQTGSGGPGWRDLTPNPRSTGH